MALQLASEEPEGGPWRVVPLTVVVEGLLRLGSRRAAGRQRQGVVLAVDGRSSGGKTTLAARLQEWDGRCQYPIGVQPVRILRGTVPTSRRACSSRWPGGWWEEGSDLDGDRLQRPCGRRWRGSWVRLQDVETALAERVSLDLIRGTAGVAVLHRRAVVEAGDAAMNVIGQDLHRIRVGHRVARDEDAAAHGVAQRP